ncbi:MAG TPA: serine/threonine-protein kinase [Polyangiaceae bacterium]|nr:serine/threonine-protein kinase [Polyangiaceae bacterium]
MTAKAVSPAIPPRSLRDGLGLSPAQARIARTRLGAFASILAVLTLTGSLGLWALFPIESRLLERNQLVFLAELGVALDAGMMFLVWGTRWNHDLIIRVGWAYQLLRCLTLSLSPMPADGPAMLTWASITIVAFPILLPMVRPWSILTTVTSAMMPPGALWLVSQINPGSLAASDLVMSAYTSCVVLAMALLIGDAVNRIGASRDTLVGGYRLLERVGVGGMGEVWSAKHRFLARSAAIKLIPQRPDDSARAKQKALRRFRREAQVTAQLSSPHTVQVFDYGTTDAGLYYYVMEYLDGFDLQELVRRFGPLSSARALYIMRQVCDSIGEAHENGLIHRDLKPSNLFVVRRGLRADFVKVLDFGLVGLGDRLRTETYDGKITAAGMMTGTPAYMSPEMALGNRVDGRADLYSLGCVFYFLLTGKLLYPGLSAVQMALAHAHDPPPHPSDANPTVDPVLETIIMRLLAKNPAERPQSAQQLVRLLDRVRFDEPWSDEDALEWWQENKPRGTGLMQDAVRRDEAISEG